MRWRGQQHPVGRLQGGAGDLSAQQGYLMP
jgi:hypothetical protein